MTNEDLHEYYGWLSHKFGFFEDWRDRVSEYIKKLQSNEYENSKHRADFSAKVFDEILMEKVDSGEISEDMIFGLDT
jgi:hypothetical protein